MALRVPLMQALLHDWTKFFPPEHAPYVEFFYVYGTTQQARIGPIRDVPGFQERIVQARDHHQFKNPHHWQHWLTDEHTNGTGEAYALPMPERFVREMVADWTGAGRAQGYPDTVAWYQKNKHEIVVHPDTQRSIERLLDEAVRKGITWSE